MSQNGLTFSSFLRNINVLIQFDNIFYLICIIPLHCESQYFHKYLSKYFQFVQMRKNGNILLPASFFFLPYFFQILVDDGMFTKTLMLTNIKILVNCKFNPFFQLEISSKNTHGYYNT